MGWDRLKSGLFISFYIFFLFIHSMFIILSSKDASEDWDRLLSGVCVLERERERERA